MPVSHKVVETDPNRGAGHVSYAQNEHIGQTKRNGTINDARSLTQRVFGTDDDIHVIPLTHSVPLQRSHDKTLDQSIEMLRTSLRSLSKYVKDGSQVSQTDIIEETDKDRKGNTLKHSEMTHTYSEKEEATNTKKIKRHTMYKEDSGETSLKDKEAYQDFIDIGKQMLEQAADRIEQQDDNSEDEEENLIQQRIEKLKLQARMIEEQNQRKAEEAKQMADIMRMFKLEQERFEKRKKENAKIKTLARGRGKNGKTPATANKATSRGRTKTENIERRRRENETGFATSKEGHVGQFETKDNEKATSLSRVLS